jgi:TP53 regulating kinase-like protein
MTILAQGAEAVLTRQGNTVLKHRLSKDYRIAEIDIDLRRSRQRREEKVIARLADNNIAVPTVLDSDEKTMTLTLTFIDGPKVRDVMGAKPIQYGAAIGTLLSRMHKCGVAHGDPTTSNFIAAETTYVIDFGLSFFTLKIEDFAVDLHLLRQVLSGTHTEVYDVAWQAALDAYVKEWPEGKKVIDWLVQQVEKRGRNKKR